MAGAGVIAAAWLWPAREPEVLAHEHPELPAGHPHLKDTAVAGRHAHAYVIDDLHAHWPSPGR